MRIFFVFICLLLSGFTFSTNGFCSEIKELTTMRRADKKQGSMADRIICVDGLKVFQTIAFGYGNGTGAAASNIQLYEEKNGKVVPVTCK